MYDGFIMGLGFACVLVVLGAIREIIGAGTLFADMDLLLGPMAADWGIQLFDNYPGFLLAVLPPGAFIFTGLLIALKNTIDRHLHQRQLARQAPKTAGGKRVRVTGNVA